MTCSSTEIWHGSLLHVDELHWYTDIPMHGLSHFTWLLHSWHGWSVHSYVMFSYHCYTCMSCLHIPVTHACMVSLFLSYGSSFILHVLLFHVIPVFLLYDCFPLLILYSRYWIHELLICDMWNPTSIVPVSRYRVWCYQQSSCHVIVLHVPYPVLVPDILYSER